MLVIKKINKTKLIVYISIMALMFGGSGYFIYKTFSITPKKIMDNTKSFLANRSIGEDGEIMDETAPGKQLNLNVEEASEALESTIFNDPKFKNLKETDVDLTIIGKVGNDNPFNVKKEEAAR